MSDPRVALQPTPRPVLTSEDRRTVESVLREIAARDGRVTPESFLAEAEPEVSPLHRLFEWDDTVAAFQHRLHQARQIVRTVVYRTVPVGEEGRAISARVKPAERAWVRHLADQRREAGASPPALPATDAADSAAPAPPSPAPSPPPLQPTTTLVAGPRPVGRPPMVQVPRRRVVPVRVRVRDDPKLVVPELEILQEVSADVVGDREDFVAEIVDAFNRSEGRLRVEDLARACWDGGHNRAALAGDKLRGRS